MTNWFAIVQMVLGLGLVIFVHELGHFLAARWCKVDVRVFSLGFGPPLLSFMRGGTRYQIALVPIGGFVSMCGEYAGDRKGPPAPGDVLGKSVGQRFFIYSAGVLMNLLFAVVLLPILFWIGVPFVRPMIGEPAPGGPAWQAGLQAGTEVLEVEGQEVFDFGQLASEVALADKGPIDLLVRAPGATTTEVVTLEPVDSTDGFRVIDVDAPLDPNHVLFVRPGGVAERAGLRTGERLIAVTGQPQELSVVRQLSRAMVPGRDIELVVADSEGREREVAIELVWEPSTGPALIGVAPCANLVVAVRGGGPLADVLAVGTRLQSVRGVPIGGAPDLLEALLERESFEPSLAQLPDGSTVDVTQALEAHVASRRSAVAAAADIALGPDLDTAFVSPSVDGAARAAGLRTQDRVTAIDGREISKWNDVLEAVRGARSKKGEIAVHFERTDASGTTSNVVDLVPRAPSWADIGFDLSRANYVYRTSNPGEALRAGLASAVKNFQDVWLALERILTAEISSKNMGGVISMGVISYHTAKEGPTKLLFFLCILSINLAVINVLPIPVLDGGHLLFLILEKIKGSPVSERVLGYSQLVGFVMVISLVVYVTWNDLQRWVLG